jgi:hyperosmotically inducible protein
MSRAAVLLAAVLPIAAALGLSACGTPEQKKEDTARTSQDAALTAKVKSAIATDVGARAASNINVESNHGVVRLTGFVDDQDQADRATNAAKKVGGIQNLKSDLRIKSS